VGWAGYDGRCGTAIPPVCAARECDDMFVDVTRARLSPCGGGRALPGIMEGWSPGVTIRPLDIYRPTVAMHARESHTPETTEIKA